MKNLYLTLIIALLSLGASAQNLVVNPSFEETATNCSQFGGESFFTDLEGTWDNANSNTEGDTCSSPDLFAPCNNVLGFEVTGMPNNELGWQYARTGERYVGIITHSPLSNYREYIQGRTSSPLVAGQQYCVSFFVSRGDDVPYATNNLGILFSDDPYLRDACPGTSNSLINETPQINYDCAPITDTTNWVRLQWNYTATGGEQYFTIGNFFNNANTTIVNVGGGGLQPYAYYYIDDVSIIATDECCFADILPVADQCENDGPVTLEVLAPLSDDCPTPVSGTWSGPGVNAATGVFTPATAGTGTHTITYTLSCGYEASTSITVNACAELNVCVEPNGQLTVSGGSGNYTWESQSIEEDCSSCQFGICEFCFGTIPTVEVWTEFSSSQTATPPGTWPIRVTDGQGGIVLLDDTDALPDCEQTGCALTVVAQNVVNACGGTSGSVTVSTTGESGAVSYTWNTNPAQTGPTASDLEEGEYTVTATDGACEATLIIAIQDGAIEASAGEDVVICKGESTVITASGGTDYNWENGASLEQSVEVSPSSTTTYTVEVTSGNCSATAQVTVTVAVAPLIEIDAPATSFCTDNTDITLTGSPEGGVFSGPGINGDSFNPANAGAGTHTITYTYTEYEECPYTGNIDMNVDICTGFGEPTRDAVSIHPNPTDGLLFVESTVEVTKVLLFDAVGRSISVPMTTTHGKVVINLRLLAPGTYLLRTIDADGGVNAYRVLKQ